MYKEKFAKRFAACLSEKGWDEAVAAANFGISVTMVRKYPSGVNFPKSEPLIHMADNFGVSLDWLVGRTDAKEFARPKATNKR